MQTNDSVINSLMATLTKRVEKIAKDAYDTQSPIKSASEVLWGIMFTRGGSHWMMIGDVRYAATKKLQTLGNAGMPVAKAADAVRKAINILSSQGLVDVEGDRIRPNPDPDRRPELLPSLYHRWCESTKPRYIRPVALPGIQYAGPATLRVYVGDIPSETDGIFGYTHRHTRILYEWEIRDRNAMFIFGEAMHEHLNKLKQAVESRPLQTFVPETLRGFRLSGDPLAAAAAAVLAWGPDPTEVLPGEIRYDNFGKHLANLQLFASEGCGEVCRTL